MRTVRSHPARSALINSAPYKKFKRANPQIEFVETQNNGAFPVVDGYYRTNKVERKGGVRPYTISLRNFPKRKILEQLDYLRGRTATGSRSFTRVKQTPTPTVQGFWTPDLDLAKTNTAFEALELAAFDAAKPKPVALPASSASAKV